MRVLDKEEQLVWDAQLSVCIMGNGDGTEFELLNNGPEPALTDEFLADLKSRGLEYLGVIGIVDGRVRVALAEPLDADVITLLSAAFVRHAMAVFQDRLRVKLKSTDAAVQWCRSLFEKPDTRPNA